MIRVLSEATINKIAAGEVIENPASVVKELVENALDAGSQSISIEIKGGGFQLIRITDDGYGMSGDDAVLCFERHATSKISEIDDLSSLNSMGFRGEALASIAAISRIDLTTAQEKGSGTHVVIEGGRIGSVSPASRQQGTTFEVRSLFYNVPARRKFQKSATSSAAEIHKLVVTLALAHPEIGFELYSNEQPVLKVRPAHGKDFLEKSSHRINDLFETSFLATKLQARGTERDYLLEGILGTPADHRVNRTGQYLFVNRRPVFSPQVARAIKEGYGQRLDEDRYPVFVLFLNVPSACIDVNVHPQKKEVRFQEGEFIRQFVKTHVHQAFGGSASVAEQVFIEPFPTTKISWDEPLAFREEPQEAPTIFSQEQVIGLFEHYLLLDGSTVEGYQQGVVWVDLQKAQQVLIWQSLNQPQSIMAQGLLIPLSMELSALEAKELDHCQKELAQCGFVVHSSGKQSILIEAIPPFLDETDAQEAVRLVLQSEDDFPQLSEKVARFAVRRKKTFMMDEALTLWKNYKKLNSKEGITWIGMHAIENLFK